MRRLLMDLKRRLYVYTLLVMFLAIALGNYVEVNMKYMRAIGVLAVFLMLYPMMVRLAVEKLTKSAKNYRLIVASLFFAYAVGPLVAHFIGKSLLLDYPELYAALILVGTIPCSNMLIGWSGIAGASVEDALVVAVIGLLSIPVLSPPLTKFYLGSALNVDLMKLFITLTSYILLPLLLGYYTRKLIIRRKGAQYFNRLKEVLPGFSALGVLLIVFVASLKASRVIVAQPILIAYILVSLLAFYLVQTGLALLALKALKFGYETGFIFLMAAVARSQAISLAVAATLFPALTVLAISFKPVLQVLYILTLIYPMGDWLRRYMG